MPVVSVGDMAQQFNAMRNSGAIKTELSSLAESMSTGRVADITAHLDGQTTQFSGINYSLTQLDGYLQTASETRQTLVGVQIVLDKLDASRNETSAQLLLLSSSSTTAQVDEAGRAARGAFDTMVSTLNTQLADRALMGGAAVDGPPLASANDMMADLQTFIGGATTQAAIETAIDYWFDDPAGGFATMGYLGDAGPAVQRRVTDNKVVGIDARANDPAVRDVLKSAAYAAVANDLPGLDNQTKSGLLRDAGVRLFAGASGLIAVQARIGFVEESVDRGMVEMNAQRTALAISKNDLISADPFDTASRLQSVQLQLETHFTVTARMSKLSLLGYI